MAEEAIRWGGKLWAAADLLTPMAIRVAATLRLADHITAGTCTADALAAAVGADRDALARLMAHLVTAGVLAQTGEGTFGLTGLGEQLRDDDPAGIRPWLDLEGAIGRADLCFVELLHTVGNEGSCRVAQKCGYVLDSVLPPLPPKFPDEGHRHLRKRPA